MLWFLILYFLFKASISFKQSLLLCHIICYNLIKKSAPEGKIILDISASAACWAEQGTMGRMREPHKAVLIFSMYSALTRGLNTVFVCASKKGHATKQLLRF